MRCKAILVLVLFFTQYQTTHACKILQKLMGALKPAAAAEVETVEVADPVAVEQVSRRVVVQREIVTRSAPTVRREIVQEEAPNVVQIPTPRVIVQPAPPVVLQQQPAQVEVQEAAPAQIQEEVQNPVPVETRSLRIQSPRVIRVLPVPRKKACKNCS